MAKINCVHGMTLIGLLHELAMDKLLYTALTGGGGKTSLMYLLGQSLSQKKRVLLSTTTKIYKPKANECKNVFIGPARYCKEMAEAMQKNSMLLCAHADFGEKLIGYNPHEIELLKSLHCTDAIICECDGSRGRALKFYNEFEPPVPQNFSLLIAVAAVDALFKNISEETVCRADKFSSFHNLQIGEEITASVYENYLLSTDSPLKNAPQNADKILLLNKWDKANKKIYQEFESIADKLLKKYKYILCASVKENKVYEWLEL